MLVQGWGNDLVLFFSFNSVNRALTNDVVKGHINALYGAKRAAELRDAAKAAKGEKREELLIEKFIEAVNDLGFDFVIPYVFEQDDRDRTSHYLMFITKNKRGFAIMKGIMYAVSEDKTEGVARFGYVRAVSKRRTPLLALLNTPLSDLGDGVCELFAGELLTWRQMSDRYNDRNPRNSFVDANWRKLMLKLEDEGRIKPQTVREDRRPRNGEPTFSDKILVRIPPKEKK